MQGDDRCQLQVVYHSGGPLTLSDRVRTFLLRLNSALKRRLVHHFSAMEEASAAGASAINRAANRLLSPPGACYQPGDEVEVLTMEEIRRTLDGNGCCGRLQFMPGMARYAGKRCTVLKPVRTMFDERAWKMVRVKDTVVLRDVICDGVELYDKEGCDRCCYYFWKTDWLRRVR
ncbi:hypothetical protein [Geomonas anaerohicana]|uniref:Uncharacterized protein n=1 Tax=Geomonas anaerohicana TaxID=2798583 RepID=A0ABS0YBY8_9BACT|nr:hypothetical protein [Geomonas anaerohicana]MBJ6749805.1 hypothetical protein [Geomonas anaerohicana]